MFLRNAARLASVRSSARSLLWQQMRSFAASSNSPDRRYVRISGLSPHVARDDMVFFMQKNNVDLSASLIGETARLMYRNDTPYLSNTQVKKDEIAETGDVDEHSQNLDQEAYSEEKKNRPVSVFSVQRSSSYLKLGDREVTADDVPFLGRIGTDSYLNQSIWLYDAGNEERAREISSKLNGKLCGMKLARATVVSKRVFSDRPLPFATSRNNQRPPRSHFLSVISPASHERDRALLLNDLPSQIPARFIWAFFGMYDVSIVRLLRKEGLAAVIFRSSEEAHRALRERQNLPMHGHGRTSMRLFN